jgi:3-phosphoshikimate 1-carboxyvinyltransferase
MREVAVHIPGDKSITHRAILFSTLATGTSRIRDPLDSADTRSSAHVVRLLGADVPATIPREIVIPGRGLRGLLNPDTILDCGNSGTTTRLLMGILAGYDFDAVLTGDDSLQSRPMRRVTMPLTEMGAKFTEMGRTDRLPVKMRGSRALKGITFDNAQSSAQVKSALLLAGLTGDAPVTVTEPRLSRDHTERMLAAMGVTLHRSPSDGFLVAIDGASPLQPIDITVPGDFSSAAFFIACATLTPGVRVVMRNVGLTPGRVGMLDVLRRMRADVHVANERIEANEPVGDIRVTAAPVVGTDVAPDEVPAMIDEIPAIAALAARAAGETRITGARELRVKETDRIAALVTNLRAIGVDADELDDGLVVQGNTKPLKGDVRCHGDHRIAMAFGVLASLDGSDIRIDQPNVVDVSFPSFWRALHDVTGKELNT